MEEKRFHPTKKQGQHLWSLIQGRQDDDALKDTFLQLLCSFNSEESHRKIWVDINIGENSSQGLKICKILCFSSFFPTFRATEGCQRDKRCDAGFDFDLISPTPQKNPKKQPRSKHMSSLSQRGGDDEDDILKNAAVEPALLFHVHTFTGFLFL